MDANTHTSRTLNDGAFLVPRLGFTNFVGGPKALEWALAFRDGKRVPFPI